MWCEGIVWAWCEGDAWAWCEAAGSVGTHQDHRNTRLVVFQLGVPLGANVLKRGARDEREGNEEDVSLRIGERSQAIVVFLAGRIPEPEVDRLAVDHYVSAVIVENGRHIILCPGAHERGAARTVSGALNFLGAEASEAQREGRRISSADPATAPREK